MNQIVEDLRSAVRQVRRTPGFALVVIATLTLGIGAASAAVSLLNALVLRPLDAPNPERLVAISLLDRRGRASQIPLTTSLEIARRASFESVCAYTGGDLIETEIHGRGVVMRPIEVVTPRYYEMLGVRPVLGRLLSDEDVAHPTPAPVTVISYGIWQREFGGATDAIGRTMLVAGQPLTIVGVTPQHFTGLRVEIAPELAVTTPLLRRLLPPPDPRAPVRSAYAIARLHPDVTLALAEADLRTLWASLPRAVTSANSASADLQPAQIVIESVARGFSSLRPRYSTALQGLVVLTGLLLLIGCLNLSGILVTIVASRHRELAICLALGAGTWRLARQLLLQNLLLTLAGAAAAIPVAQWATRILAAQIWTGLMPMTLRVAPDGRVLGIMAAMAAAAAIVITMIPAYIITRRVGIHGQLRERRARNRSVKGVGKVLVVAQVALSFAVLFSDVLLVKTLAKVRDVDVGFKSAGVVLTRLTPRLGGYQDLDESTYYPGLVTRLTTSFGVTSAALARGFSAPVTDSRPVARSETAGSSAEVTSVMDVVSPRFFETLQIPVLQGRDFTWRDDIFIGPTAIINRSLQERLFPDGKAVGQRIRMGNESGRRSVEVIGVVGDIRNGTYRSPAGPALYRPWLQERPARSPVVLVRGDAGAAQLTDHLHNVVASLGREHFQKAITLDDSIGQAFMQERVMAGLSIGLAALTLLLAFIGVYGMQSYGVARRTREIGVRMALGASRPAVIRMVFHECVVVTAIGVAAGVPFALWSAHAGRTLLFGLSPFDGAALGVTMTFFLIVGSLAGMRPAYRASLAEPMTALRAE
ncbi:MAG TPA: ADOP family duplicated permease [Vicinamibacterales bacterium]|nr:ADOP family duplicated permease [Vicinamibacterales bacterium]